MRQLTHEFFVNQPEKPCINEPQGGYHSVSAVLIRKCTSRAAAALKENSTVVWGPGRNSGMAE